MIITNSPAFNLLIIITLPSLLPCISSIDIDCIFRIKRNVPGINDLYSCYVTNLLYVPTRSVGVENIRGNHARGKSVNDLGEIIIFDNKNLEYIPSSLGSKARLKSLIILACRLKEVTRNDMAQFPDLRFLELDGNFIEIFENGLFDNNPQLVRIKFVQNRIRSVGLNVFDNLQYLSFLDMSTNVCVSDKAESRENVLNLLSRIKRDCSAQGTIPGPNPSVIQVTNSNVGENTNQNTFQSVTQAPFITVQPASQPSVQHCGKPRIGIGNIIGGVQVTPRSFPWIAALISTAGKFFCGGTLVSPKKVISAAHCIQGKGQSTKRLSRDIRVALGIHNLNNPYEPGSRASAVQKALIHPNWNPDVINFDADIAAIILESTITFDDYVQPICLASPTSNLGIIRNGLVIGYGKSEDESKPHENIPRILEVPIHDNAKCFLDFPDLTRLSSDRTFCGGRGVGTGVCSGDSGSGLIVVKDGAYYLRGIVSSSLWTTDYKCDINSYAVFTDVLKYSDWIERINENEFYG